MTTPSNLTYKRACRAVDLHLINVITSSSAAHILLSLQTPSGGWLCRSSNCRAEQNITRMVLLVELIINRYLRGRGMGSAAFEHLNEHRIA